jgi:nucleoside 2-deoxyribosyltransferase
MMRIYLAGPMRGYADNNVAAFNHAATALRTLGHAVWSPAEHDQKLSVDDSPGFIREVFRRDLDALLQQEAVVLLDGWNRSHGAALERHAADVVGMPVFLFEPRVEGSLVPVSTHDWRWMALRGSNR